jgi:hypothetical protein
MASVISRDVTEKIAQDASESVAKGVSREVATEASEAASRAAAREAASGGTAAAIKSAAEKASRDVVHESVESTARAEAETASRSGVKQTAESATKAKDNWLLKNPKLVIGGIAATTIASVALARFVAAQGKVLTITAIGTDGVTYKPAQRLFSTDSLAVSKTDSVPVIDGTYTDLTPLSETQVRFSTRAPITGDGKNGTMVVTTTYEAQVAGVLGDAAKGTLDVAGDAVSDVFGINRELLTRMAIAIGSVALCSLLAYVLFVLFKKLRK